MSYTIYVPSRIDLDLTAHNRGLAVEGVTGTLRLASLETGTTNGGIDIDFPVTVRGRIGRRVTTELGRGDPSSARSPPTAE